MTEDPSRPKYKRIADHYEQRIRTGDLVPDARLPSVRGIADQWGVASATAAAVLAELVARGLAITRRQSGSYVRQGVETTGTTTMPKRVRLELTVQQAQCAFEALKRYERSRTEHDRHRLMLISNTRVVFAETLQDAGADEAARAGVAVEDLEPLE